MYFSPRVDTRDDLPPTAGVDPAQKIVPKDALYAVGVILAIRSGAGT
jgi:hypothetical protein